MSHLKKEKKWKRMGVSGREKWERESEESENVESGSCGHRCESSLSIHTFHSFAEKREEIDIDDGLKRTRNIEVRG